MTKKSSIKKIVVIAVVFATVGFFGVQDYSYAQQANELHNFALENESEVESVQQDYRHDTAWMKVIDRVVLPPAQDYVVDTTKVDAISFPASYLPGFQKLKRETYADKERKSYADVQRAYDRRLAWKQAKALCDIEEKFTVSEAKGKLDEFRSAYVNELTLKNLAVYSEYCGADVAKYKDAISKVIAEEAAVQADDKAAVRKMLEEEAFQLGISFDELVRQRAEAAGMSVEEFWK